MSPLGRHEASNGPLRHRCGHCGASSLTLIICTSCWVVRYCDVGHQAQHRKEHGAFCNSMISLRETLQKHEDKASQHAKLNGFDVIPNTNNNRRDPERLPGDLWNHFIGGYAREARYAVAAGCRRAGTLDGIRECLYHLIHMLRLPSTEEEKRNRGQVASLMLRLNQDQRCYDFIKWWEANDGREMRRAVSPDFSMDLTSEVHNTPLMEFKGADVMEDPAFIKEPHFQAAALLIKTRMLIDICKLETCRKISFYPLPVELWKEISKHVTQSEVSAQFVDYTYEELVHTEQRLLRHCRMLGSGLMAEHKRLLVHLLDLKEDLIIFRPQRDALGRYKWMPLDPVPDYEIRWAGFERPSIRASLVGAELYYPAWAETPGALELLRAARDLAARVSEVDIPRIMDAEERRRSAEEVLRDLSVTRLFDYLDYAVQDLSYFGPRERRPSARIDHLRSRGLERSG